MSQIAIIGDKETIFPFNAVGFDIFVASSENIQDIFKEVISSNKKVIFITEELVPYIEKEIKETMRHPFPVVTFIPSITGGEGNRENIVNLIERIVGPNLLKGD